MASASVMRMTTVSPTFRLLRSTSGRTATVRVVPSSNWRVALWCSASMAVTLAVTCVVSAMMPPGLAPLGASATNWAPPSVGRLALAGHRHHQFLGRRDLELVADLDLVEVDDLRPDLDRLS